MNWTLRLSARAAALAVALLASAGCASLTLGRPFAVDPRVSVKVGYDTKGDVLTKLGPPFRTAIDDKGREILTYVWADGEGSGAKCLIALNKNGLVYLVETYP